MPSFGYELRPLVNWPDAGTRPSEFLFSTPVSCREILKKIIIKIILQTFFSLGEIIAPANAWEVEFFCS